MQINLNKAPGKPIYIQLYDNLVKEISSGHIKNNTKLPPRRVFAESLGIAETTVDNAYKMLQDTGYAISVPRQGYFVSYHALSAVKDAPFEIPAQEQFIFSPNGIDTQAFNRSAYAKTVRSIAYNDGMDILSYPEKIGEGVLRSAIAKYLYSFRNIKCSPGQIIIGAGAEYLLTALSALFDSDTIYAMEDPGPSRSYYAFKSYGKTIKTIPVDMNGIKIEDLYASGCQIFYTIPNYHFPTGHQQTPQQREALLGWVQEKEDRYIIEDGFDCELLWNPADSLYSQDTSSRVIYMGSFSRSLCPALKTSYLVLPQRLWELWKTKHPFYYALTSKLEQYALAEFINKGNFNKHYKSMRRLYKEKRDLVRDCLQEAFGDSVEIAGVPDSTYLTAVFHLDMTEHEIQQRARQAGVKFFTIKKHIIEASPLLPSHAFLLGIGDLSREQIRSGIRILKKALTP